MVAFARDGTIYQKEMGLRALEHLSRGDNKAAIVAAGGVSALAATAQDGTFQQKEYAAKALSTLLSSRYCQVEIKVTGREQALKALAQQGYPVRKAIASADLRSPLI